MNIILLNGPPSSGKDFAGFEIWNRVGTGVLMKFAEEVKVRTHAALYLCDEAGHPFRADHYEDRKDQVLEEFGGITPRAAYIQFSEGFAKPLFGERIFGTWLADKIEAMDGPDTVIITDSGFMPEAEVLVERFGAENCLLARIHRVGYTFAGDSRSYIDLAPLQVQCQDINNDGADGFRTLLGTLFPASRA